MNSGNTVVWNSDPDAPWNEEDVTIYVDVTVSCSLKINPFQPYMKGLIARWLKVEESNVVEEEEENGVVLSFDFVFSTKGQSEEPEEYEDEARLKLAPIESKFHCEVLECDVEGVAV